MRDQPRQAHAPACPHFPDCVGCPWIARPYAEQLAAKRERVEAALAGALADGAYPAVPPVVSASAPVGYRVQSKLMVGQRHGAPVLGLYRPGTHQIADASRCPLHAPLVRRTALALRDALAAARLPIHQGERPGLRYVLIRVSTWARRVLVTFVTSRATPDRYRRLAHGLRARLPVAGVLLNENRSTGNVILGPRTTTLAGAGVLHERYGPVVLEAGPTAFVQANTAVASRIYAAAARATALTGRERVVDLYCGVGGIALTVATRAAAVHGIDEVEAAIGAARRNARRAGQRHVRFDAGRVEGALALVRAARADVITLNPPRRGCGAAVASAIAASGAARVVYVSCQPESFARDTARLTAGGYRLAAVAPYDLLPHTEHVELVGTFVRA